MAKITGVRAVDMVNGEITKVEYAGSKYSKVEAPAKNGDIAKVKKAWGNQVKGAFYPVIQEDHIFYKGFDNYDLVFISGEKVDASESYDHVDLFRKVSEPLKVGDYVKVVDGAEDNIGVIAEIKGFDFDYAIAALNPINSSFPGRSFIDRLRKATDEEVAEAKKESERLVEERRWAKIGRKPDEFKKGDIVRYNGAASVHGYLVEVCADTVDDETKVKWPEKIGLGICYEKSDDLKLVFPVEARFDA